MLREAEQYLAQAQWVVLQTPDCDPAIKSQLYRDLGLLYTAQGNITEAKKHFAEDVSTIIISCASCILERLDSSHLISAPFIICKLW